MLSAFTQRVQHMRHYFVDGGFKNDVSFVGGEVESLRGVDSFLSKVPKIDAISNSGLTWTVKDWGELAYEKTSRHSNLEQKSDIRTEEIRKGRNDFFGSHNWNCHW